MPFACSLRPISRTAFMLLAVYFVSTTYCFADCSKEVPDGLKNSGASLIDNGNPVVNHPHWPVTNDVNQPNTASQGYTQNGAKVDPKNALNNQVVPPAVQNLLQGIPIFGKLFGALGTQSGGAAGSMGGGGDNKGCDAVGGCTNVNYSCDSTAPTKNSWATPGKAN